jgi:hypothetical protein
MRNRADFNNRHIHQSSNEPDIEQLLVQTFFAGRQGVLC